MIWAARPVPVLVAAAASCAAVVTIGMALATPLAGALAGWSPVWQQAAFALLLYGALAAIAAGGRRFAGIVPAHRAGGAGIAIGTAIGVGGFALALGEAALSGVVHRAPTTGSLPVLAFGTLVMIGQSASEELFFRGWLQPVLVRAWGPLAGIVVTALAFTALHVAGGARAPLTLVNLALGGLVFGVIAWRIGLAAAVAAHAGWNWAEAILFGLDPNPGEGAFGAAVNLDLVGAARWGGSAEGLNDSLAMAIVLIAILLPLAVPRRGSGGGALSPTSRPG